MVRMMHYDGTMLQFNLVVVSAVLLAVGTRVALTESVKEKSNVAILPNGSKLNGVKLFSSHSKKPYLEFRGIPYAKAPSGNLRFKPTEILDEDLGTRDALEYGNICPQLDPLYDPDEVEGGSWDEMETLGDENCLFVNVATPDTNPSSLLPVLVWFHGGNFQSESGQDYGAGKLMDHDLVVVNFNYRLGALGFLNTNDETASGNMGLKDQSVLLQWVQKNIRSFGGDPNSVTVAGSNAGAVSVHLHMISQMSKGLFHKAIIQSGTAISPWAFMKDPKERIKKLAKLIKCGNNTDEVSCIVGAKAKQLVQKTYRMLEWFLDPMVPFGPSVETVGKVEERFLSKNPYIMLQEGNYWSKDIPVIMGVNSHEGLLHAMDIGHQGMLRKVFNMEWFKAAPVSLYYKTSALDPRSVSEAVRHFYFPLNQTKTDNDTVVPVRLVDKDYKFENLTMMYSDRHFFVPLHHSAKLMGKLNKNLFLYWFDYVSDQSIHGLYGYNSSHIFGPSHYDQLQFLFETTFFNETTESEHIKFERHLLKGLYRFVKDGRFEQNWTPVSIDMTTDSEEASPFVYNRIGKPSNEMQIKEPFAERVRFWNSQFLMEYDRESFIDQFVSSQESTKENKKDEL